MSSIYNILCVSCSARDGAAKNSFTKVSFLLFAKKQIEQSFTFCCDSFFMLSKIVFFFLQLMNISANPSVR